MARLKAAATMGLENSVASAAGRLLLVLPLPEGFFGALTLALTLVLALVLALVLGWALLLFAALLSLLPALLLLALTLLPILALLFLPEALVALADFAFALSPCFISVLNNIVRLLSD